MKKALSIILSALVVFTCLVVLFRSMTPQLTEQEKKLIILRQLHDREATAIAIVEPTMIYHHEQAVYYADQAEKNLKEADHYISISSQAKATVQAIEADPLYLAYRVLNDKEETPQPSGSSLLGKH